MNPAPTDDDIDATGIFYSFATPREKMLALSSLLFTVVVLLVAAWLFQKQHKYNASDILRVFGLILIIGALLFLMSAGFDGKEVTGAVGLLGAIAGYILGKTEFSREEKQKED